MLAGEAKYKEWLLEYVDAWVERIIANGGIIPSNIGLDGTIGGECDGKWYGGCYGWGFTTVVPQTGKLAHRNALFRGIAGFGNALLLTGDQSYVDVWRQMIDTINANQKIIDGEVMYPHMYGDEGWYSYRPQKYSQGALDVYYWSMNRADLKRLSMTGWITFLEGKNPTYPVEALQRDFVTIQKKVQGMRQDTTTPDTRLSDDPMPFNPATVQTLIELMLGGILPRHGEPLHCRVRYFDPIKRRAGIPEGVAALVEQITEEDVTLTLVNINQIDSRTVVVQGGAYAEHQFVSVTTDGQVLSLDQPFCIVRLAPGSGSRIVIKMKRYANQPTFLFPWDRD